MSRCSVRIRITGLIQGVGYRYFCYRTATSLGLVGEVKNNFDGSVEVEAHGERGQLEILIKELKVGPMVASVRDINLEWGEATDKFDSFDITG